MKEILGEAKTIRQLLSGAKYSIDYYQREYKWRAKQVFELIDDLTDKFSRDYDPSHERQTIESYGHYFLGSIIISNKDARKFLIDGQQRLTTLTLLLILLRRSGQANRSFPKIDDLIYSERFGKKSFNLDVEDRTPLMDALFHERTLDEEAFTESLTNIAGRFRDIEHHFPEELLGTALPFFTDWLIENVHLVEITAYSDEDAYTIFETMNDRGLSLSPTEMLKGYLLANISDVQERNRGNDAWKHWIDRLVSMGKEEEADCLKSWLRGQYAESIRDRTRGAIPQDFDRLGTEFHRWIREHADDIGLVRSRDFSDFIERDFSFYARQYERIREAETRVVAGLEALFYVAQHGFTLQYPVLLAPLTPHEPETEIDRKLRIVAAYLEIVIARRLWNFKSIAYSTMQYAIFVVMKAVRRLSVPDLVEELATRLEQEDLTFKSNPGFRLHQQNRRAVHRLLARLTAWIEVSSGAPSHYLDYVTRSENSYEVEHIWANKPERFAEEFKHPVDFDEFRNRIGGLLLLPKSFNASYGDLPYEGKLIHYDSQNLLARSLNSNAYERNPGFVRFTASTGLPFRPHPASSGKTWRSDKTYTSAWLNCSGTRANFSKLLESTHQAVAVPTEPVTTVPFTAGGMPP
ncbi:MAG: DUF262 domain-containing protein [Actinomycetota bacterium]